jgi:selenocysteine lyase/cysteine desulfurase
VIGYLQREAEIGGYETAAERERDWLRTYDAIARLLDADREEIAIVENATHAWDMAFYAFAFQPGNRILTGRAEYSSKLDRAPLEQLEPPLLDLHAAELKPDGSYAIRPDARRFENWETYYAGKVGLGVAVEYALEVGVDAGWQRIQELSSRLRSRLGDVASVTLADRGVVLGAIVTFDVAGSAADDVERLLVGERIKCVSDRCGDAVSDRP